MNISLGGEKGAHARVVRVPGHHAARAPRRSQAHLTQHVRRVHVRHPRGRQGARDLQVRRVASPRANAEPRARARRRFSLADANARADADIRNPLAPPARRPAPRSRASTRRSLTRPAPPPPPARLRSARKAQASKSRCAERLVPSPRPSPVFPPRSATLFPTAMSEVIPSRRRASGAPRVLLGSRARGRGDRGPRPTARVSSRPDAIARGARGAPDPDPVCARHSWVPAERSRAAAPGREGSVVGSATANACFSFSIDALLYSPRGCWLTSPLDHPKPVPLDTTRSSTVCRVAAETSTRKPGPLERGGAEGEKAAGKDARGGALAAAKSEAATRAANADNASGPTPGGSTARGTSRSSRRRTARRTGTPSSTRRLCTARRSRIAAVYDEDGLFDTSIVRGGCG